MRIEPVGVTPSNVYFSKIKPIKTKKLGGIDLEPLLPPEPKQPESLWDIISSNKSPFSDLFDTLKNIVETKLVLIQVGNSMVSSDVDSGVDYEKYLQFPNPQIQALAYSIVSPTDSNDQKIYKIEQWVIHNISYVSDLEQYGISELWTFPTVTVRKGQGDCEDGAFLIHSLALNAGVPSDRLRTYGGLVVTSDTASAGGHAWAVYRRSSDDQWITLDWCYYPKNTPLDDRTPMGEDLKYIDDYFFVGATKTVETPYTNRVRFAVHPSPIFLSTIA